jgi:hypothetical protein
VQDPEQYHQKEKKKRPSGMKNKTDDSINSYFWGPLKFLKMLSSTKSNTLSCVVFNIDRCLTVVRDFPH